jgi:hypothetical protein
MPDCAVDRRSLPLIRRSAIDRGRHGRAMGSPTPRSDHVKKTEMLKVRIDAKSYAALMQYCEGSGQTASYVLRKALDQEFERLGTNSREAPFGDFDSWANDEMRALYVRIFASILIAQSMPTPDARWQDRLQHRHLEVSRLIDSLLRTLSRPTDKSTALVPSRRQIGANV